MIFIESREKRGSRQIRTNFTRKTALKTLEKLKGFIQINVWQNPFYCFSHQIISSYITAHVEPKKNHNSWKNVQCYFAKLVLKQSQEFGKSKLWFFFA